MNGERGYANMAMIEQKCKDANYRKEDINSLKDKRGTLKVNNMEFEVTILRMTRYVPPPLRVAKTCFTSHKPGCTFAEVRIEI